MLYLTKWCFNNSLDQFAIVWTIESVLNDKILQLFSSLVCHTQARIFGYSNLNQVTFCPDLRSAELVPSKPRAFLFLFLVVFHLIQGSFQLCFQLSVASSLVSNVIIPLAGQIITFIVNYLLFLGYPFIRSCDIPLTMIYMFH